MGRIEVVAFVEQPAANERDAERVEVLGRRGAEVGGAAAPGLLREQAVLPKSFGILPPLTSRNMPSGRPPSIGTALTAATCSMPGMACRRCDQAAQELRLVRPEGRARPPVSGRPVPAVRDPSRRRVGSEARVDREHLQQAAAEQAGADQQRQRHRESAPRRGRGRRAGLAASPRSPGRLRRASPAARPRSRAGR